MQPSTANPGARSAESAALAAKSAVWAPWAAAILSAALLELPFPLAGPLPPWRSLFAWFALVPLLWAVLSPQSVPHPARRAFLLAYLCGVLWYAGNCYWIYDTMLFYGGLPPVVSALLLIGFSLVLGLYFGLFGLGVHFTRRSTGSNRLALAFAPFLWTALDLAAARITSVPWDQLGYSQVDNALLSQLAPWTGVYGLTFVLVAVNALLAGALLFGSPRATRKLSGRWAWAVCGAFLFAVGFSGVFVPPPEPAPTATAVLIQPNLNVGDANNWFGAAWNQHIAEFTRLAQEQCTSGAPNDGSLSLGWNSYIAGIPQTGAPTRSLPCPPSTTPPDLVAWPESPAPFIQGEPRFAQAMRSIALAVHAPLIIGGIGTDFSAQENAWRDYNSAIIIAADGHFAGRYDKIHLVPFGEYVPFQDLLSFAHKLTGRVGQFSRGQVRTVFLLNGHRYGVFICYEAVFADEVRQFARRGAQVLVNISDDGWYGDTSAPWQHLNMARMRAIENRRWLLRDTNTGVTASIDPYGRVRRSLPRHHIGALPARFAFNSDTTFYTAHGDLFAWLCSVVSGGLLGWAVMRR
jgi:apolipoprotein N-acyltransferase